MSIRFENGNLCCAILNHQEYTWIIWLSERLEGFLKFYSAKYWIYWVYEGKFILFDFALLSWYKTINNLLIILCFEWIMMIVVCLYGYYWFYVDVFIQNVWIENADKGNIGACD